MLTEIPEENREICENCGEGVLVETGEIVTERINYKIYEHIGWQCSCCGKEYWEMHELAEEESEG